MTQKVAETVALEQRLTTAECQNRAVTNKLHRHNELTQASKVWYIIYHLDTIPKWIFYFKLKICKFWDSFWLGGIWFGVDLQVATNGRESNWLLGDEYSNYGYPV